MGSVYWNDQGQIIADVGRQGRFGDRAYVFTMKETGWIIDRPRDPDNFARHTSFTGQLHPTARRAAGRLLERDDLARLSALADPVQVALACQIDLKFTELKPIREPKGDMPRWCYVARNRTAISPLDCGIVYLWCEQQFGRPRKRWTYSPAPRPRDDQFHFRDESCAFTFKMRWC